MTGSISDLGKLLAQRLPSYLVLVPLLVAVAAYVAGLCLAPDIDTDREHARWGGFFATGAQVIATLFVALILERRVAARTKAFRRGSAGSAAVVYAGVGLLAASAGLSPSLSDDVYRQAFALTVAAGVATLLAIVLVGLRAFAFEYAKRDAEFEEKVLQLYAAVEEVKSPPRQ
jgi:MFS family permease